MIAEQSQGIPRKINSLCFGALSLGFAMGRNPIDAEVMEEVIADRDVESFERPRPAARVEPAPPDSRAVPSSPTILRPPMFSYSANQANQTNQAKPKRSFGRWAFGAASVTACVALGIGILSLSPGRIDWSLERFSEAWTPIRNGILSIRGSMTAKSDAAPASSPLNVQAGDLPNSEAGLDSSVNSDGEIDSVIVQPGERLRQVILRTMGEYNGETIEQIRKLNPDIGDLDHLQAGQTIRFPRVSASIDSVAAGARAGAPGKN
jgi:hypothetical protein